MSRLASLFALALILHVKVAYRGHNGREVSGWGGCSAVWVGPREVLSAAHCLGDEVKDTWIKTSAGKSVRAHPARENRQADLVLLSVDSSDETGRWAKLGPMPSIGDKVEIVANPGNLGLMYSEGIVEGFVDMEDVGHRVIIGSAMVARGSSGGPVFDRKGRLVGLAEITFSSSGGMAAYIPVDIIKAFLYDK